MDDLGRSSIKTGDSKNIKYPCKDGTLIYTTDGNRAEGDKRIHIKFPKNPWVPTIECLLAWIRAKAWLVEDNNYSNGQGMKYLHRAIQDAFYRKNMTIREICKKFKIPGY